MGGFSSIQRVPEERIVGNSEEQSRIPHLISLPTTLVGGCLPQKLGAGISGLGKEQM